MKTRLLPLLLLALGATAAADVTFIDGVGLSGGWYDVNKRSMWFEASNGGGYISDNGVLRAVNTDYASNQAFNASYNGYQMIYATDSSMCWAASTANTLQWWQDRKAQNSQLPAGIPNGKAETAQYSKLENVAQLDIYQVLYTNFSTSYGGSTRSGIAGKTFIGWDWWFNGNSTDSVKELAGSYGISPAHAGYWSELGYYTKLTSTGVGTTNESTLFSLALVNTDNYLSALTDPINASRAVSLTVTGAGNYSDSGHAVTLWGYEQDGADLYLYLTDSDDYYHGLVRYLVTAENGAVTLSTTETHPEITNASGNSAFSSLNGMKVSEVYALAAAYKEAPGIPEPTSSALLLLAATALVARRRR